MAHLRKLTRPSPPAARRVSRSLHGSEIPYLRPPTAIYTKDSTFIRWASHFSFKDHRPPPETSCFRAKIKSSMGIRGFSSKKNTQILNARYRHLVVVARSALMDYLNGTRGLPFTDAEHMARKSPIFLQKILKKVEGEEDGDRALRRFFRYKPINEFEPFFESVGLKPSEFAPFLPRDLMFLSDDRELLVNYRALCNYGIARGNIGKMYKEATGIFRYEPGVLGMKLGAYEALGLSKSSVIKVVASCPTLLIGDVSEEFVKVLEWLEDNGIERDWIGSVLSERSLYDWGKMMMVPQFLLEIGFSKQEMGALIRRHLDFLVNWKTMFSMVVLLMKFGATRMELFALLSQFPGVLLGSFMRNLGRGLIFLVEIEMDAEDIRHLLRTHTKVFGLCSLKRPTTILSCLSIGMKRLCKIIKEDPHQLENFTLGAKIAPLRNTITLQDQRSLMEKRKFLLRLGFVEDSEEMKKALNVFRGKGDELQGRYVFLVKTGLDPNDVSKMIKIAPHILNQKIDALDRKIKFLVNNMGYPLSSLVAFPQYVSHSFERVKLRILMYNWLRDRGKVKQDLALSSILTSSEKIYKKRYVNQHPMGLEVWENFKKTLSSS